MRHLLRRHRALGAASLLFLALPLLAAACKGGISDPTAYREAAATLEGSLGAVTRATEIARTGSDPMEFGRNLGTLLPPLRELQGRVTELKVKDATLLALHQELAGAVDAHLAAVEALSQNVTTTPLKEGKDTLFGSIERFDVAVAAWREAVAAL